MSDQSHRFTATTAGEERDRIRRLAADFAQSMTRLLGTLNRLSETDPIARQLSFMILGGADVAEHMSAAMQAWSAQASLSKRAVIEEVERHRPSIDITGTPMATSALRTLIDLGYTWNGGELWRPPIGKRPHWIDESQGPKPVIIAGSTRQAHAYGMEHGWTSTGAGLVNEDGIVVEFINHVGGLRGQTGLKIYVGECSAELRRVAQDRVNAGHAVWAKP